jgi:hypothetical protein
MSMAYGDGRRRDVAPQSLNRRRFLHGTTATAGLLTLDRCGWVRTASGG